MAPLQKRRKLEHDSDDSAPNHTDEDRGSSSETDNVPKATLARFTTDGARSKPKSAATALLGSDSYKSSMFKLQVQLVPS